MAFHPSLRLAATCALPLSLAACGSSSSDDDDNPVVVPEGPHHGYVISKVAVPSTDAESRQFGLDVGSPKSAKLDGNVDNALGDLLIGVRAIINVQPSITSAIDRGAIDLLVDLQATDFTSAAAVGLAIKFGTAPNPPACIDANDSTCRHHLEGTAAFQIAADSPTDSLVTGKIADGSFSGGPGNLTLQLTFGGTTPSTLHLLRARARASGISETGISNLILAGVVTDTELKTQVGPAVQAQIVAYLSAQCTGEAVPPVCGCTGLAASVIPMIDLNQDCTISVDEVFSNPLVASVLKLDSCSKDTCDAPDGYAIGVRAEAVKATFPM